MKEKTKNFIDKINKFIKENKKISLGMLIIIIILLVVLIVLSIKNSTYAIDNIDYVEIICPETAKAGEEISCSVAVNIATFEARDLQIDTTYSEEISFVSFELDSNCTKENNCLQNGQGGPNGILFFSMDNSASTGFHSLGTLKYKIPENAKSGEEYTINFNNIQILSTDEQKDFTPDDIVKKIRIPSDVNTLDSITLSSGNINEEVTQDNNIYTATVDSDSISINVTTTDKYSKVEGNLENISLHYGTNNISIKVISETGKENIYTVKIFRPYTFNIENYIYDKENNYLYTKGDIDNDTILSNITLPSELTGKIDNNKLIISYSEEKLLEINLINISSNKYTFINSKVCIGKNVDYQAFIDSLNLNGVTIKVFDSSDNEVTDGILTVSNKLKVYFQDKLLEEYTFSEEYLNILLSVDKVNNIINRVKQGTTASDLLSKINTSGSVNIKDKTSGNPITNTSLVKTGDIVEIAMESGTYKYTISVLGDLSGNGTIDTGDVGLLYRYLKGKKTLEPCEISAGDIINDGNIKINDVARLYRYVKEKIAVLEVE